MENKELKHQDSLQLIESMIEATKEKMNDNGNIWLMWGFYVLIASVSQFTMLNMEMYKYSWIGWMLWPICLIFTIVSSIKQRNEAKVKTHLDSFMISLWTAFGIAIVITIAFTMRLNHLAFLPFCMLLYGIGTYVSGGALKFNPLKYGGLICFLCAAIAFNVNYNYQLLLIAFAVLTSYIIPGFILKSQYKKQDA